MAENEVLRFFCSAFLPKPVRKRASKALRGVESVPGVNFPYYWEDPIPKEEKRGGST